MDDLPEWAKDTPSGASERPPINDLPAWAREPDAASASGNRSSQSKLSPLEKAVQPITSLPSTYQHMVDESVGQMGRGVGQISSGEPWEVAKGLGNVALGGLGYVTAPINAPLHTIVGKPIEENTGSPMAGTLAELGAGFLLPVPKGMPRGAAPIAEEAPYGVTLTGGERANNLAMRQAEQQAIRSGEPHGQAFVAQREAQLQSARDRIARGFDPFGQEIAEGPQEAGAAVSEGMQNAATAARARVRQAYDLARSLPGEVHADVFRGMGANIRFDLSQAERPVVVDDRLTPYASQMIADIDNRVSQLHIQNRASFVGQPNPQNIVGINLEGVDQMRKRLSAFRQDAYASGNAADGRAAQAVLDAFDGRVDRAINGGMFNGDPRAVQAWNDARAAYADYRGTFTAGRNDPVGRVVEKIIGRNAAGATHSGPAIANDVADFLYGASGTNPSSLNVGVANRIRDVLGEHSPEWIAVRQGLFRRLVEQAPETPFGTQKTADRLNKFLKADGTELSQAMFSPDERRMLQGYADLMQRITMPKGSYFPSAPPLLRAMNTAGTWIARGVGAAIGKALVPAPVVGEIAGAAAAGRAAQTVQNMQARRIANQMPIIAQQMERWNRAQSAAQTAPNTMTQRALTAATVNMQKALTPLGVRVEDFAAEMPGTSSAQEQPQARADGGAVFAPHAIGARKAKNGFWYIDDPDRPGKYLIVLPKKGRAAGGAVEDNNKFSKDEAQYRPSGGTLGHKCMQCAMFKWPNGCTAVAGQIKPGGVCDLFEPKREAAA
jgi:hypothetical protein